MKYLFALFIALVATGAGAQANEPLIRRAVDDYLRIQIKGLPGRAHFTIDTIQSSALAPCSAVDVSTAPGAPAMGRSSVTVRCLSGANWSLLVPFRIHVIGDYLVSARPLAPGQTITAGDVATQSGDLGELPPGVLTSANQAIGLVARAPLHAGRPLRGDLLKAPVVVQQGQSVKVVSRGNGFEVANEGRAMGSATVGQVVQVRLGSGQVVSGIADQNGNVEINF